jgi:NADPH:quinone reductase-like Zn-dependent oxidoreductase
MQRREVFGTSGVRLKIRMFGGWGYSKDMLSKSDWVKSAYAGGVPMGGDLSQANGKSPSFIVWAPASHVYPVPDAMPLTHAATFPTTYLTAHHALFATGGLQAGETVLIHAAGSGVSVAGIQLAKHAGATVLATARSDAKCERALTLGADHVCNTVTTDVVGWAREATGGRGVDMVFDHVGTALFGQSLFCLATKGRLVNCGNSSGDEATSPSLGYLYHMGLSILGSDPYRPEEFGPVWQTFCDGGFEVAIDAELPLAEAALAQDKMLASDFFGKILLIP